MKKFLTLALVTAILAPPAFADGHGGKNKFERKDTNGDGVISKAEFMDYHAKKFGKIDADDNGEITKEEVKAYKAKKAKKKKDRKEKKGDHGHDH